MPAFDTPLSSYYYVLHAMNTDDTKSHAIPLLLLSKLGVDGNISFFSNLHQYLFFSRSKLRSFVRTLELVDYESCSFYLANTRIMCVRTDSLYSRYVGTISTIVEDRMGDYVLSSFPCVTVLDGIVMTPFDATTETTMIMASQLSTWASEDPLKRFILGDGLDEYRLIVAGVIAGLFNFQKDFINAVMQSSFKEKEMLLIAGGLGYYLNVYPSSKRFLPLICRRFFSIITELYASTP
jgi:hypothetical protein